MSKNPPLVSYVIRTYNEAFWLETLLRIIYEIQSYQTVEVILIDSGSTDETVAIAKDFPIRLFQIPKSEFNYSKTLNLGIEKAKGEYICILSGHSLPTYPQFLEHSVALLEQNPDLAAVTGYYTNPPDPRQALKTIRTTPTPKLKWESRCPWMTNTSALIRKALWKKYPFDQTLVDGCEDYDWALEMLALGYDVLKTSRFSVYHSHEHVPDHVSFAQRQKKWKPIIKAIDAFPRPRSNV